MPPANDILSAPTRLSILAFLTTAEIADFKTLAKEIGLTSGNLSTHVSKLEQVKYVGVTKKFVGKKPLTTIRITPKGRDSFIEYVNMMEQYYSELSHKAS